VSYINTPDQLARSSDTSRFDRSCRKSPNWPIHLTGVELVRVSPGSAGGWAFQGRWMAASTRGLSGSLFWLRLGDQVAVAHRVVVDG
jgi:hypothetical protein